jgi:hypothetical protein
MGLGSTPLAPLWGKLPKAYIGACANRRWRYQGCGPYQACHQPDGSGAIKIHSCPFPAMAPRHRQAATFWPVFYRPVRSHTAPGNTAPGYTLGLSHIAAICALHGAVLKPGGNAPALSVCIGFAPTDAMRRIQARADATRLPIGIDSVIPR